MMGEPIPLLGSPGTRPCFEGPKNLRVKGAPAALEQAAIGHVVGEGVLERVLERMAEARLI